MPAACRGDQLLFEMPDPALTFQAADELPGRRDGRLVLLDCRYDELQPRMGWQPTQQATERLSIPGGWE